jgi:hypothetical protein
MFTYQTILNTKQHSFTEFLLVSFNDINLSQFAWRQWQVGPTRSHIELGSETD